MMLPMSFLLPGLAPDLAWTLGMDVPKDARATVAQKDGRAVPEDAQTVGKTEAQP
jgi:hypothetical protein